jgi:hypothetical protein
MGNINEAFVAECLKSFLLKQTQDVSYVTPELDPPDKIFKIDGQVIAVEITEINLNTQNDRKTIDTGYLRYIDSLDGKFKELVPTDQKVFVTFYHHYRKISTIRKKFESILQKFIITRDTISEHKMDGVAFKIEKLSPSKNTHRKITGCVTAYGGKREGSRDIKLIDQQIVEANLSLQSSLMIRERIEKKSKKCQNIDLKCIWLVLHEKYYDKFTNYEDESHIEHYREIFADIVDFGLFQKIFVVFENEEVLEFSFDGKNG